MQTKQDAIIRFSATVKNVLDTTKATIPLDDSDIIKNCNTSIYNAHKCMRDSFPILDYHRRHKDVNDLVLETQKIMRQVGYLYLQPYGDTFRRWHENQFQKEMSKDENFLDELYAIQAMETKCLYYDDMVKEFNEVQKIYIDFSAKLQKNLNTLEPSEFELSKNNSDKGRIKRKVQHRRRLSSSCEDLSSKSTDSVQFVPTALSKSTTKHFVLKFPMISGGVSRTTSSESLNTLSC